MRALITGITGQDGSYLAELLLGKGYEVFGMVRRTSQRNYGNIQHILDRVTILDGDLLDELSLRLAVKEADPDEVYNLAAQSFVGLSITQPIYTSEATGLGVLRLLETIRHAKPDAKIYQAGSSEMFGDSGEVKQNENTPFSPRSPYGAAKVFGHHMAVNYREAYDMFICNGVLFNHESPRRGKEFVTRKITSAVAEIACNKADHVSLGCLDPRRDWGYAKDYVWAMWLMLQQDAPDDYVIGTGKAYSVEDFVRAAFDYVGISNWNDFVRQDPRFMRPTDIMLHCADYAKAVTTLNWTPRVGFNSLVALMVAADLERIKNG